MMPSFFTVIYIARPFRIRLGTNGPINEHTASTLALFLHAIGIPVSTRGNSVAERELAFKIIPECAWLFMSGLFMSFVVFRLATVLQKATGLAIGIPALYAGNLIRLAATFMVIRCDPGLFDVFHVYLGQVFAMFLVILVCTFWLKLLDKEEQQGFSYKSDSFFHPLHLYIWVPVLFMYKLLVFSVLGLPHALRVFFAQVPREPRA